MSTRKAFVKLVLEVLESLPTGFRERLENVEIVIEDTPSPQLAHQMGMSQRELLGLYQGVPLKRRGFFYGNVLPDRITIYRMNILRVASNTKEIKERVKEVLLHEIGHHFGLEEEEMRGLDE